jgi:hypothetical protein
VFFETLVKKEASAKNGPQLKIPTASAELPLISCLIETPK